MNLSSIQPSEIKKGKFVVLYGVNNLGKTTQAKRLVAELEKQGLAVEYMKFSRYDVAPSGPISNRYLRAGNPDNLTPREFQIIQVLNKTQVMPDIVQALKAGKWVVAEDYIGGCIAWGMAQGITRDFLEEANSHLLKEDLVIHLDGERFLASVEVGHKFEQDTGLVDRARLAFQELAKDKSWHTVSANQTEDKVFGDIWREVEKLLKQ